MNQSVLLSNAAFVEQLRKSRDKTKQSVCDRIDRAYREMLAQVDKYFICIPRRMLPNDDIQNRNQQSLDLFNPSMDQPINPSNVQCQLFSQAIQSKPDKADYPESGTKNLHNDNELTNVDIFPEISLMQLDVNVIDDNANHNEEVDEGDDEACDCKTCLKGCKVLNDLTEDDEEEDGEQGILIESSEDEFDDQKGKLDGEKREENKGNKTSEPNRDNRQTIEYVDQFNCEQSNWMNRQSRINLNTIQSKCWFKLSNVYRGKVTQYNNTTIDYQMNNRIQKCLRNSNSRGLFECPVCGYEFSARMNLKLHLEPPKVKPTRCRFCDRSCGSVSSRNEHERTVHTDQLPIERSFLCAYCDKTYLSGFARNKHERIVHLKVKCKLCSHVTTFAAQMIIHIRSVHLGNIVQLERHKLTTESIDLMQYFEKIIVESKESHPNQLKSLTIE